MTTKTPMPWETAQALYGRTLGAKTPKALDRAALEWNGESADYPGEPAAGDYHLHQLLFLNIQAQAEVALRLDDLIDILQREGQSTRKGIRKVLERLDALRDVLPGMDDEEDEEEPPAVEEARPAAAPRRGPRLVAQPSDYPHPIPTEDKADSS